MGYAYNILHNGCSGLLQFLHFLRFEATEVLKAELAHLPLALYHIMSEEIGQSCVHIFGIHLVDFFGNHVVRIVKTTKKNSQNFFWIFYSREYFILSITAPECFQLSRDSTLR